MSNGKSGRKKLVRIILAIIIFIIATFLGEETILPKGENTTEPAVDGELQVHMIDVGQADCFLLIQGDQTALVDCGTRSTGKDAIAYLKELGITKLDYVFGTHPHDDHMGGMYDVITTLDVGTIVIPKVKSKDVTSNWYQKLMKEIKDGDYETKYVKVGDIYEIGEADMKVIGPINDPNGELNNYSTVLKVSFGKMDMIMTGDAEKEVEKDILASGENIDAEILKVGHHGSDTSSCDEFVDSISPNYALISCELGNKHEHPTESTMQFLKERNIEVYRTDENGTVIATITTDNVEFNCEPGDYLSGVELEKRNSK